MRVRHIATRFALILGVAAVLPLLAYGAVSIVSLQQGTRGSITAGHENVAVRAAEEIRRYVTGHADILKALASSLQDADLETWQKDRILKDYILQFRQYREITLFDEAGGVVATSRASQVRVAVPERPAVTFDNVAMSAIRIDADELPTALFSVELRRLNQPAGWLVGEINLEEMWRMVDQIRIGRQGFALVVARDGTLVAHGDPESKVLIAQATRLTDHPLVGTDRDGAPGREGAVEYSDADGRRQLAVAAPIETLGWTVIVEQPVSEAYASASALTRQLTVAISLALALMVGVGLLFGRRFIAPIFTLKRATQDVAGGNLQTRVTIDTGDEFTDLGHAFNTMADRLVELQEDVKRKERQAMFGRITAGLVHDISHPIQNIGNSTRLLFRDEADTESRELFRRTIERELGTLKRFIEDLRNVAKPAPVERYALEVDPLVAEVVESLRPTAERAGVALETRLAGYPLVIEGDRFALGRVYRNLVTNAIQATQQGGRVVISTARVGQHVEIDVTDTGSGIEAHRLAAIFDDFVTTKRRGLGLGLAISKRIVEQLDGTISVDSEVGRGTSFTLRFPALDPGVAQVAAS